jgi:hypothetical protein
MAFQITQNDTYPSLIVQLFGSDGNAVDVTDATIEFHMEDSGQVDITTGGSVVQLDPTTGVIAYEWVVADTNRAPGDYYGEFEVTFDTGEIGTWPTCEKIHIQICREIA